MDSTNKYAAVRLAEGELRHGAVILAHAQEAGVGQRGRVWHSGAGLDIALSVVLLPKALPVAMHFAVSKMAALAVHDVVAGTLALAGLPADGVRIKWPNDILIGRRKVSGILISNDVAGAQVQACIVGIGLNVNSSELDVAFNATSLRIATGREHDRMALVERLCQRIEAHWDRLMADVHALDADYSARLWMRGRFADLELDGAPFQ
ncbi:MAG TPA: biotin--[acetyl-CoA-carboxylase] ligase, partial [Flavobacteriales bacterium]|nr:biotin--[acetyl-CoA-carboxylase] ligase [Flavobacteriales bacterium]